MRIAITGRHINLGDSLESYVNEKLKTSFSKILPNISHAEVVFSKNGYKYLASIIITEGHSLGKLRSNFDSDEIYHAFDGALIRLEKQLRKHKEIYRDHQATKLAQTASGASDDIPAKKYTISTSEENVKDSKSNQHLIIAEKNTRVEALTVAEAVMRMDLTHAPALLFKNKQNGRLNLVFYRADGNISWVDPEV
jgi:ribosomal subunit interface protein